MLNFYNNVTHLDFKLHVSIESDFKSGIFLSNSMMCWMMLMSDLLMLMFFRVIDVVEKLSFTSLLFITDINCDNSELSISYIKIFNFFNDIPLENMSAMLSCDMYSLSIVEY